MGDFRLEGYDMTGAVSTARQAIETPDLESWKTELVSDEVAAARTDLIKTLQAAFELKELLRKVSVRVDEII